MNRLARSFAVPGAFILPVLLVAQTVPIKPISTPGLPPAVARPPVTPGMTYGTLFFNTNIGSFKIKSPGDNKMPDGKYKYIKAEGAVTMDFNGTVLVSGLEGSVVPVNVRKEYEVKDLEKDVYFGRGRLVINGKFKSIQFFGRDLRATFRGMGAVFLAGEFDSKLSTGEYWYDTDPTRKPWNTGGMTVNNPPRVFGATPGVKPRIRDEKAGG